MSTLAKSLNPVFFGAVLLTTLISLQGRSESAEPAPAPAMQPVVMPGAGFQAGMDGFATGAQADPVRQDLPKGIAKWLSAEFSLPEMNELPAVAFVSKRRMIALRFRDVPSDRWAAHQADIVAVYDDEARTIYLPDGWTGKTAAELSVLVHEMVHHLQNLSGQKFACLEERENMAYRAQARWLGLSGGNLEKDFGVDPFTVLARTTCSY